MLHSPIAAFAAELPQSFSVTPEAFNGREPTVAELMAEVILANARDGQNTAWGDLTNAGFSAQEIGAHFAKAKAIADTFVIRQDAIAGEKPSDPWVADTEYRQTRVTRAAGVIAGILAKPADIHLALRKSGFSAREIGDLWPEFMAEAGSAFQHVAVQS